MKDTLLFPAYNVGECELDYSLRDIDGGSLLVLCPEEFAKVYRPRWNHVIDDFSSPGTSAMRARQWAERNGRRFTSIIAVDEEFQFQMTKAIAQSLAIPFYSDLTLMAASNKAVMKSRFQEMGVPTSDFIILSDAHDKRIERIGFPNVLKVPTGNSSEYIFMNKDHADLERNIAFLKEALSCAKGDTRIRKVKLPDGSILDPKTDFLLEGFVKGIEYSCDFMISKGTLKVLRIVRKMKSGNFGYFSGFFLVNHRTAKEGGVDIGRLEDIGSRIASALSLDNGIFMADFMSTADGIKVIETNIRPGLSTFIPLMQKIYGYTSLGLLTKVRMGSDVDPVMPDDEGAVFHVFSEPGKITRFDTSGLDAVKDELGIIGVHKYYGEGDVMDDSPTNHHGLLAGFVLVKNPKHDEIEKIYKSINERIILTVEKTAVEDHAKD